MPVQVHAAARADLSPFSHAGPKARVHRRFLLPGATGARDRWEGARPRSKQPLDPITQIAVCRCLYTANWLRRLIKKITKNLGFPTPDDPIERVSDASAQTAGVSLSKLGAKFPVGQHACEDSMLHASARANMPGAAIAIHPFQRHYIVYEPSGFSPWSTETAEFAD